MASGGKALALQRFISALFISAARLLYASVSNKSIFKTINSNMKTLIHLHSPFSSHPFKAVIRNTSVIKPCYVAKE
ncbi:hypothetical protein GTU79_21660 [Sodalis ligni]|uniref:hypothetical protein n=1 Tax=Sodalis ligni TaxID=2697027 RepID=UPI001BDDDA8B|nr:hypothetical protein [Sodalis ligni]QWA09883.1 hypothetical protein GTU79_21660 [Sodalis ligni]